MDGARLSEFIIKMKVSEVMCTEFLLELLPEEMRSDFKGLFEENDWIWPMIFAETDPCAEKFTSHYRDQGNLFEAGLFEGDELIFGTGGIKNLSSFFLGHGLRKGHRFYFYFMWDKSSHAFIGSVVDSVYCNDKPDYIDGTSNFNFSNKGKKITSIFERDLD